MFAFDCVIIDEDRFCCLFLICFFFICCKFLNPCLKVLMDYGELIPFPFVPTLSPYYKYIAD